ELVGLQSGGNIRVTARIDVRIHAQRDPRHALLSPGDCRNAVQLPGRLRVDRADLERDRRLELVARLADASEDDVFGVEPGTPGYLNLAPGIRVDTAAKRAQQSQQRKSRVGLERVMNGVGVLGKGGVDLAESVPNRSRAVHVRGRTDGLDDGVHADAVAEETRRRGLER